MLWPPRGTRLPPTNATVASEYSAANSPMLSTRNTPPASASPLRRALWVARCKDHHRLWMIGQNVAKRRKQSAFFVFERAATHQDRPCSGMSETLPQTRNNLRRQRWRDIEFQVTGYGDL